MLGAQFGEAGEQRAGLSAGMDAVRPSIIRFGTPFNETICNHAIDQAARRSSREFQLLGNILLGQTGINNHHRQQGRLCTRDPQGANLTVEITPQLTDDHSESQCGRRVLDHCLGNRTASLDLLDDYRGGHSPCGTHRDQPVTAA